MRPTFGALAAPTFIGAALGASVLALSTKALAILIAGTAFATMAASVAFPFYILVATVPVQVDLFGHITVTKLITPLTIGMVTFNALIHRGPWPAIMRWPAGYLAGTFFLISLVSLAFAKGVAGLPGEAAKIPVYGALFFFTLTFTRTPEDFRRLLWVIAFTGLGEALITAAQVHYGFVMPGDWRKNLGHPGEGGVDGTLSAILDGKIRAEGTTSHPIMLASFFLMAIPCTAFLCLTESRASIRILLGGMLALMGYAWFHTFARSSMIGFAVMAVVALTFRSRAVRIVLLIGAVLVFTGFLSYQAISESFSTGVHAIESGGLFGKADVNEASGSWEFRLESIVGGWRLFGAHPWLGVGFGQSIWHYTKYLPDWANHSSHPSTIHNVFLEVASELGVFALAAFLGLWGWALISARHGLGHPTLRPYAILMSSIIFGQMAFLMITPMVREIWLTLPMAMALGYMAQHDTNDRSGASLRPVRSRQQAWRTDDRGVA